MGKQQQAGQHFSKQILSVGIILALFWQVSFAITLTPSTKPDATAKTHLVESYGKLPLSFEANQGQTDKQVKFISRGKGYGLFLTPTEAVLSLQKTEPTEPKIGKSLKIGSPVSKQKLPNNAAQNSQDKTATLRMKLVNSNPNPKMQGLDELPSKVNYIRGKDPKKWQTNIPTYAKAKYEKVYPGINLIFYGNGRQLEYDFIVAPGADPKAIRLDFSGADKIRLDKAGDLLLHTQDGELRLHKPVVYQTVAGKRQNVEGSFVLHKFPLPQGKACPKQCRKGMGWGKSQQVGFQVAAYDAAQTLVIDPVLVYSTYLGGSKDDFVEDFTADGAGNAYVTGSTSSPDFPAVNAKYPYGDQPNFFDVLNIKEVFVTKFDTRGAVLYSTYLGGNGEDYGYGIAVDNAGNAYVTGKTDSFNFPVVNAKYQDMPGRYGAFLTKFDASGSQVLYSTYLGGGGNSVSQGNGVAVDSAGNAYVTGKTSSPDFPAVNAKYPNFRSGGWDSFVTKFSTSGAEVLYSTYLGGDGSDEGNDIAVDSAGNAYVTGITLSTDFPTHANDPSIVSYDSDVSMRDAFVTKFSASGAEVLYSTYLGGDGGGTEGRGIAVDDAGNAYVTGWTNSANFPTHANDPSFVSFDQDFNGGPGDAFVTKFDASGSHVLYSTYLGGSNDQSFSSDEGNGIAVDSAGNAYVTGITLSTDFPVVNATYQNLRGLRDAFVTKFDASGAQVLYSTYLGGDSNDEGKGIAVDSAGNAYVTGSTSSANFPTHANDPSIVSFDQDFNGGSDTFVAKISDNTPPIDTDGDGLPDDYEIANGLNPNDPNDAALDKDNDGLSNLEEFQNHTNPSNLDSDKDGFNDGDEVVQATDPLDPNSFPVFAPSISDIDVIDAAGSVNHPIIAEFSPSGSNYLDAAGNIVSEQTIATQLSDFLFYQDTERSGYVADGNARLLLRVRLNGNVERRVRFDISSLSNIKSMFESGPATDTGVLTRQAQGQKTISLPTKSVVINGVTGQQATAVLVAEEQFPGEVNQDIFEFNINVCIENTDGSCGSQQIQKIKVKRAPVVLIHGLWSSYTDSWGNQWTVSGMASELKRNFFKVGFVEYDNWKGPSETMKEDSRLIYDEISRICRGAQKYNGYACTRADIVAHSMGGLVARKFVYDNNHYKTQENFKLGSVRRLVTLGTPHKGAGLANLLTLSPVSGIDCISQPTAFAGWANLYAILNLSGRKYGSALDDLSINSYLQVNINSKSQDIKTFAVIGNIGINIIGSWFGSSEVFQLNSGCSANELFQNTASDGLVSITSAQGKLPSANITMLPNINHVGMGTNQEVIKETIKRLNGPVEDFANSAALQPQYDESNMFASSSQNNLTENGRNWVEGLGAFLLKAIGITDANAADTLPIVLNINNSQPMPGSQVIFNASIPGTDIQNVLLTDGQSINLVDGQAPYEWSMDIPAAAAGSKTFKVVAIVDGTVVGSNSVTVTARPDLNALQELVFDSSDPIVLFPGQTKQIYVSGRFNDGITRNLTQSVMETVYSENLVVDNQVTGAGDSPVISVTPEGMVRAETLGSAEVVASNHGFSAVSRIIVEPVSADDADGDGLKDVQEDAIGTSKLSRDSDGDGTQDNVEVGSNPAIPIDSNGDGIIDAKDSSGVVAKDGAGNAAVVQTSAGILFDVSRADLAGYPALPEALKKITMTNGLVGLTVKGLAAGQSTNVTIKFDNLPNTTNRYLGFGTQSANENSLGWYEFPNFSIDLNQVTLQLTDNGLGDSNPTPGILEFIGGPGSAPPNQIPIANAGVDQNVQVGSPVNLDGSGSTDPDNAPSSLTYNWTQVSGPTVALAGATTVSPSFTPTASGTYLFKLTVSDSLASATDEVKIDVVDTNPPVTLGSLKVNQLLINKKHKTFFLLSNFTLGSGHNGINPLNEAVSLKIGNFSTTIPASSFRKISKSLFAYVGTINKVKIEATIKSLGNNRYSFQAAGIGYNFNGLTNPVAVDLGIGDDKATTSVNAVIK